MSRWVEILIMKFLIYVLVGNLHESLAYQWATAFDCWSHLRRPCQWQRPCRGRSGRPWTWRCWPCILPLGVWRLWWCDLPLWRTGRNCNVVWAKS